tara:strand:+ start:345 stop:584 length:240 start_codon:yes stop_codon:yes gene_type:complete
MSVIKKKPWFAVKRYGYGVGFPIAWEGWLVFILYLASVICSALFLSALATAMVLILSTPALLYIAYTRSNGKWRWRSGS